MKKDISINVLLIMTILLIVTMQKEVKSQIKFEFKSNLGKNDKSTQNNSSQKQENSSVNSFEDSSSTTEKKDLCKIIQAEDEFESIKYVKTEDVWVFYLGVIGHFVEEKRNDNSAEYYVHFQFRYIEPLQNKDFIVLKPGVAKLNLLFEDGTKNELPLRLKKNKDYLTGFILRETSLTEQERAYELQFHITKEQLTECSGKILKKFRIVFDENNYKDYEPRPNNYGVNGTEFFSKYGNCLLNNI